MTQHPVIGLAAACALSFLAHGIAYASLGLGPKATLVPAPSRVAFHVHDAEPAPPVPTAPLEQPTPEPPARKAKPKPTPSVNAPQPAPAPTAVDLRGVTLTNDQGGAAWASAVGNGSALDGPVGPIRAKALTPVAVSRPVPVVSATPGVPVVEMADLSARPVPPELATNLREHYPAAAKARGIGGSALVRARIEPDGRVRHVELMNESFEGFGEACRRTLTGSSWSAPRDRDGRAVATYVRYTCRFVVGP